MSTVDMLLRLAAALSLGALIGVERQWRARIAGLRTNALVATGAALFVVLSAYSFGDVRGVPTDPTRVAAQIVSGIGFLGAGVILRDGLTVRGLNTAATLWCAAAVGSLAGAGMYPVAALGTATVLVANVALRPLARRLDRNPAGGDELEVVYYLQASCAHEAEARVRSLLVQAVTDPTLHLRALRSHPTDAGHHVTVTADLSAERRLDRRLEQAVIELGMEPHVIAVSWARTIATEIGRGSHGFIRIRRAGTDREKATAARQEVRFRGEK